MTHSKVRVWSQTAYIREPENSVLLLLSGSVADSEKAVLETALDTFGVLWHFKATNQLWSLTFCSQNLRDTLMCSAGLRAGGAGYFYVW